MQDPNTNISKPHGSRTAATQQNIPPSSSQRVHLRNVARSYIDHHRPVPPLPLSELNRHSFAIAAEAGADEKYLDYITVLTNNELWRGTLASIPYRRRLLLIPQCLRDIGKCSATFDKYGLICGHCGACPIDSLQREANRLGYVVLVAEGTPVVTSLIEAGRIDGVVGVSCMASLAEIFPFVEAVAVPAIAIPLLRDGCADTTVDLDCIWDAIYLSSEPGDQPLQLDAQRRRVGSWFTPEVLAEVMGPPASQTEQIAREWLLEGGKRWRPFLTVCTSEAIHAENAEMSTDALCATAIAVECFHKASLIHDDIEDDDALRYGRETLHLRYGVPVALNVGDFLLGEGYRLLAECPVDASTRVEMLRAAAEAHRELCVGQGEELYHGRVGRALSPAEVLKIFSQKTAPAFEVALRLGALLGGADGTIEPVLHTYSEAMGVAYQILDDLSDLDAESHAPCNARPLLLLAIAWQRAEGEDRRVLEQLWNPGRADAPHDLVRKILLMLKADDEAREMLEAYRQQAVEALDPLESVRLKVLLRRVLGKIFNEF